MVPVAVETLGRMGDEAASFLSSLVGHDAVKLCNVRQRFATALQRHNAELLLSAVPAGSAATSAADMVDDDL